MEIIVAFVWNGDRVRLLRAPCGPGVVPVRAFREAAAALAEWADNLPVELAQVESEKPGGSDPTGD